MERNAILRFVDAHHPAFLRDDSAAEHKYAEKSNVDRLTAMYKALTHGDFATFADCFAEGTEMEIFGPTSLPIVGRWKGKKEVLDAIGKNFSYTALQVPELITLVAQGDMVVTCSRERGMVKATGKAYETHFVQMFRFVDGKLAQFRQIFDASSILEAWK